MSRPARLIALVSLLGGGRGKSVEDLASTLGKSQRTIFRDLAELSELEIPLVNDEYGYRLMEGATRKPLALTVAEWALVQVALRSPALKSRPDLSRTLEVAAAKIAATVNAAIVEDTVNLADIDRSGPAPPQGVSILESSIRARSTIEADYVSLSTGRRSRRRIDPWRIVHRGESWYLVGHCHRNREPRLFRLDRMAAVRALEGSSFEIPDDFSVDAFFEHAWGVHHGREPQDIVIRFDRALEPLIGNARHHGGERIERLPGGELEYHVRLADLEEIARWVVTFGGMARAVAPADLVTRVRMIAQGVARAHEDGEVIALPAPEKEQSQRKAGRVARGAVDG